MLYDMEAKYSKRKNKLSSGSSLPLKTNDSLLFSYLKSYLDGTCCVICNLHYDKPVKH